MLGKDNRFNFALPFIDFLMTLMLMAWCLTTLMALVPPKKEAPPVDSNVKLKAEIVLQMSWPDGALDDIDMWVQLPNGKTVWYASKEHEFASLERDDTGGSNDIYWKTGEKVEQGLIKLNKETVTFRAIVPGRYVVAAHVFAMYEKVGDFTSETQLPYNATLEVIKLNPKVQTSIKTSILLQDVAQVKNFVAFEITSEGDIINIDESPTDIVVKLEQVDGSR